REPHLAVGPNPSLADGPPRRVKRLQCSAGEVESIQLDAGAMIVAQEERRAVRIPGRRDLPGEIELQVLDLTRLRPPHRRAGLPRPFVDHEQSPVAGNPRPSGGEQPQSRAIPQLGQGLAVKAEDAQGRTAAVAVFGMADAEEVLVAGQAGHARVLAMAVQEAGVAVSNEMDRAALVR